MGLSALEPDLQDQLRRHLASTYLIERELSGGGSARVFLATELALERKVVLKVLPADISRSVDAERFRREVLFLAKLQHPHLIPLLNAGTVALGHGSELRWFAMPYVEGQSLRELMQRGALSSSDVLRLLRELASALAYAHARGVVHRDIKPENVLLSEGVSMIADFGVAKALVDAVAVGADGKRVTTTSTVLGTPAYMAPEQITSALVVDHKADLYAFGCVAYELLTGDPPLLRESLRATLAAQVSDTPPSLAERRPDLAPTLIEAVMRCLEKDPNRRLPSASAIVKALDELTQAAHISGTFTAARPVAAHTTAERAATERAAPTTPRVEPAATPTHSTTRTGLVLLSLVGTAALLAGATYWFVLRS